MWDKYKCKQSLQVFLGQFTLVATLLDTRYGNQVINNTIFIVSSYSINLGKEIWDGPVVFNILSSEETTMIYKFAFPLANCGGCFQSFRAWVVFGGFGLDYGALGWAV